MTLPVSEMKPKSSENGDIVDDSSSNGKHDDTERPPGEPCVATPDQTPVGNFAGSATNNPVSETHSRHVAKIVDLESVLADADKVTQRTRRGKKRRNSEPDSGPKRKADKKCDKAMNATTGKGSRKQKDPNPKRSKQQTKISSMIKCHAPAAGASRPPQVCSRGEITQGSKPALTLKKSCMSARKVCKPATLSGKSASKTELSKKGNKSNAHTTPVRLKQGPSRPVVPSHRVQGLYKVVKSKLMDKKAALNNLLAIKSKQRGPVPAVGKSKAGRLLHRKCMEDFDTSQSMKRCRTVHDTGQESGIRKRHA